MGLEVFGVPVAGREEEPDAEVTTEESETEPRQSEIAAEHADSSKSRVRMFLEGSIVFAVMFVTLWWLLSRGDDESE